MSFIFNGQTKPYLRILTGLERPAWAPVFVEILEVPKRPGGLIISEKIQIRRINIPVRVYKKGFDSLEDLEEDLADWLITEEPKPLVFPHKPDRTYFAKVTGELVFTEYPQWGEGVISFICPDPFKYGPELNLNITEDIFTITNEGTTDALPVFDLEVLNPVTFAMIQNDNEEYNMLGQPTDVETVIVDEKTTIISERGLTLDEWYTPPGNWTGSFGTTEDAIIVSSWGSGEGWHGPALMKEITPLDDYEVEFYVYVRTEQPTMTFRLSMNLFDEFNNQIGLLRLWDKTLNRVQKVIEVRMGPYIEDYYNYLISDRNYNLVGQRVWGGIIRLRKEGNTFTVYASRITQGGRHATPITVTYTDNENEFTGPLRYVRFDAAKWGDTDTPNEIRIEHIRVSRLNKVEQDMTPYIAYPGDIITFDHENSDILINGEARMDLKQFGASFFPLRKGDNQLIVSPANSFNIRCSYRERYK